MIMFSIFISIWWFVRFKRTVYIVVSSILEQMPVHFMAMSTISWTLSKLAEFTFFDIKVVLLPICTHLYWFAPIFNKYCLLYVTRYNRVTHHFVTYLYKLVTLIRKLAAFEYWIWQNIDYLYLAKCQLFRTKN